MSASSELFDFLAAEIGAADAGDDADEDDDDEAVECVRLRGTEARDAPPLLAEDDALLSTFPLALAAALERDP